MNWFLNVTTVCLSLDISSDMNGEVKRPFFLLPYSFYMFWWGSIQSACQNLYLISNPVNGTTYTVALINDDCTSIFQTMAAFDYPKASTKLSWQSGLLVICLSAGPEPSNFAWLNDSLRSIFLSIGCRQKLCQVRPEDHVVLLWMSSISVTSITLTQVP